MLKKFLKITVTQITPNYVLFQGLLVARIL